MRKTKIVCTIGPASEDPETLKKLMHAGMNVARLNFSHGTHEEHEKRIHTIRACAQDLNVNIGIMLDTKGPEIRTRVVKDGHVELKNGESIWITSEEIEGTEERISVTYKEFSSDVPVGSSILIDDGLIELKVEEIRGQEVLCRIIEGGILKNRKSVSLPGIKTNLPAITPKDVEDILFGIQKKVDFIAASFVRKAEDVLQMKQMLEEHGASIEIISKIENAEGVENAEEIISVSDGFMVARGDLGVEIPAEQVPLLQKHFIALCNEYNKPVITATHMLESMIHNPRPTRAEMTDIANAIIDGTDAIMLSGETAAGKFPVEAVETMDKISRQVEGSSVYIDSVLRRRLTRRGTITDAMARAVTKMARTLPAAAIVTPTESGYTARTAAKYRPCCPIIAVTPQEDVQRKLSLVWGIYPVLRESANNTDDMFEMAIETAKTEANVKSGDFVIITAGVPVREPGTTNMMKVHIVE